MLTHVENIISAVFPSISEGKTMHILLYPKWLGNLQIELKHQPLLHKKNWASSLKTNIVITTSFPSNKSYYIFLINNLRLTEWWNLQSGNNSNFIILPGSQGPTDLTSMVSRLDSLTAVAIIWHRLLETKIKKHKKQTLINI